MGETTRKKLLQKEMTRKEFLQFAGGLVAILFGLGNLIALVTHVTKTVETSKSTETDTNSERGFGSRKFGV